MHARPPIKSLLTNLQLIYLRTGQGIQFIGYFGQDVEFSALRQAALFDLEGNSTERLGSDLPVIMSFGNGAGAGFTQRRPGPHRQCSWLTA
jgi:hypothetical protein